MLDRQRAAGMRTLIKELVPPIAIRLAKYLLKGPQRRKRDAVVPPAAEIKQGRVAEYGERFGIAVLVETGTFMGDMINAVKKKFRAIYSVELSADLYARAVRWFADDPHVHLIHGDSAQAIADLASRINEPCLFWLDAHYSGGMTERGSLDTPIMQELRTIVARGYDDVILIDDARLFVGLDDYPTLNMLRRYVACARPEYQVYVQDDIIFVHR